MAMLEVVYQVIKGCREETGYMAEKAGKRC